jgi:transporter family protein
MFLRGSALAQWLFYALISAVFAGLVAIFGKIGVKDVDSTLATAVRAVVMAALTIAVAGVQGNLGKISEIPRAPLFFILLSGLAGALSWLFYFRALQVGNASQVAPIDRLSVVFVLVFAVLFLREKVTWPLAIGTLLIVGGGILISLEGR